MPVPFPDSTIMYLVMRPDGSLICQIFIAEQKTIIYILNVNDFDYGRKFGIYRDIYVDEFMDLHSPNGGSR